MSHHHKLRYTDYLQRVKTRGSPNAKSQLFKILKRHHRRAYITAASLILLGCILYFLVGLHIGGIACFVLGLLVFGSDAINWFLERRSGF